MILILTRAFRRFRHLLGIDRAVGFSVLARSWSILSGALTVLLIARFLSLPEQGYYYSFGSLVSLQTVFELGFSFVILQLAAHESSQLHIQAGGEISGNEVAHSRLASILQKSVRWYSVAAVLMAAFLVIAGFHFFSTHGQSSGPVAWRLPWVCVVLASIFTFQMDPVFSFLEGCGFVSQVARLRLTQAIAGTTLAWMALTQHRGLFSPAAVIIGQAVAGFAFLVSKRRLLLPLLKRSSGVHIVGWRTEIWPFQWRIAVSFFCSSFIFPLFCPVLFAYRGAAEAGRMGMSLTIAYALSAFAYAWISTKASPFGNMIARRDFATLDHVFFRTLVQSGALLLGGEATILSFLFVAARYFPHLASRMLPIPLFALLMFTVFLGHIVNSEAVYLRAHKREPFLVLAVLLATLTGLSTLLTGRLWGAAGVVIGYFFSGGVFYVVGGTYIFIKLRRLWHGSPSDSPSACQGLI
ncbi:MAG: hypothetical protein ABSE99_18130 [Terracidiphilus sp.]